MTGCSLRRSLLHLLLNLDVIVWALAAAGDVEQAAFLAGGTHAVQERTRYDQCLPGRRRALETGIDMARTSLGAHEFDRLWSLGRRLGYDELVAAALDEHAMQS